MDSVMAIRAVHADWPWMGNVARAVAGGADTAQDLLQDLCVAALESPPREPRCLRAWASSVMRKRTINLRKGRRVILSDSLDHVASERGDPIDYCSLDDLRVSVCRAVKALPQALREPVMMRYWDCLSLKEVASSMGIDPRTVDCRVRKAKALLRLRCACLRAELN